jgi:hypothetical protein
VCVLQCGCEGTDLTAGSRILHRHVNDMIKLFAHISDLHIIKARQEFFDLAPKNIPALTFGRFLCSGYACVQDTEVGDCIDTGVYYLWDPSVTGFSSKTLY